MKNSGLNKFWLFLKMYLEMTPFKVIAISIRNFCHEKGFYIAWFKIEKNQHNSALLLLDIIYILKWHFMANFLHVHKYGSTRNVVCKHAMLNYDKLCFPFQTDWSFRKLTSLLLLLHNDVLCHRNCKHGKYHYCVLEIKP